MDIVTPDLDDPDVCRGIVLSLRTLLAMDVPVSTNHIRQIAYAEDAGTQAMIEVQKID